MKEINLFILVTIFFAVGYFCEVSTLFFAGIFCRGNGPKLFGGSEIVFANLLLISENVKNFLCQIKAHGQKKEKNSAIVEEIQSGCIVRFLKLRLSV